MITRLVPYLHFEGQCEEALHFYQSVLGGTVQIDDRFGSLGPEIPEIYAQHILHAQFTFGTVKIFASDYHPGQKLHRSNSDVALLLEVETIEEGQKIYEALLPGAEVLQKFEKQFWGAWFGQLRDRYGIKWMVSMEAEA